MLLAAFSLCGCGEDSPGEEVTAGSGGDATAGSGGASGATMAGAGGDAAAGAAGSGGSDFDTDPWIVNTTERSTQILEAEGGDGALFDVQLVERRTVNSEDFVYVETTGVPQYDVVVTQNILDELNGRPRAETDFVDGQTTATLGSTVVFGQDVGYQENTQTNCAATGGSGYWPPGPDCGANQSRAEFFAASPAPSSEDCEVGLGTIGLMVNGAAIFHWGDGMSFAGGVWFNLAPIAEQYDVDVCGGHAARGEYHHHHYTRCLADLVGDSGDDHSPVYGFAADGYPIHGPYESDGQLALSGWAMRDFGAPTSEGGCGTEGERTCVLNDPYDVAAGVDASVTPGPNLGENVTTLSGNTLPAVIGYYFEDYYYADQDVDGPQLDQHNGHDTGDGRGYHYHITLVEADGALSPAFPFTVGPSFYGALPDNALAGCGGIGPPPGGMPPPAGGTPPPAGG